MRHESREEGRGEQGDGVFGIGGVAQEWQEWLVGLGVRDERVGQRRDICW